jgi:hypothetical protein
MARTLGNKRQADTTADTTHPSSRTRRQVETTVVPKLQDSQQPPEAEMADTSTSESTPTQSAPENTRFDTRRFRDLKAEGEYVNHYHARGLLDERAS